MAHRFGRQHVPTSQHIVLSSSAFRDYFPDNNSGTFNNQLVSPFSNDRYAPLEVGLSEIGFSPVKKKEQIFATPEDGKIQLNRHLEEGIFVGKSSQTQVIMLFTTKANLLLKEYDKKLLLTVKITEKSKTLIIDNQDKDRVIRFEPESFRVALGIEDIGYPLGRTECKYELDQEAFDKIEVSARFKIRFTKDEQHEVNVQEPKEKTVAALVANINTAISEFDLRFSYDHKTFDFFSKGYSAHLSPFLGTTFGVPTPESYVFKGPHISLPTHAVINFDTTPTFVIVECSVVEPWQQWNGQLFPSLRMFPMPTTFDKLATTQFDPILYLPVPMHVDVLNKIKIRILDEKFVPLPLTLDSTTTLTLHVRHND